MSELRVDLGFAIFDDALQEVTQFLLNELYDQAELYDPPLSDQEIDAAVEHAFEMALVIDPAQLTSDAGRLWPFYAAVFVAFQAHPEADRSNPGRVYAMQELVYDLTRENAS